ncbi:hypothetical protein Ancab_017164 [Ancistrocladus abbreviatus]
MPNFFVPVVQQGQQGQRPSGRRAGGMPMQQNRPLPMMQPQMLPRGRYRYPPARAVPDTVHQGSGGGMHQQYEMGGMPVPDAALTPPIPVHTITRLLTQSDPETQRLLLGENLYPLVEQLEPEMAAKVTGMLLEMDHTEVLHLLESPDALRAKVAEAMEVLRNVAQQQTRNTADQLSGLSLNDNLPQSVDPHLGVAENNGRNN